MKKFLSIIAIFIAAIVLIACDEVSEHDRIFNGINIIYAPNNNKEHLTNDIEFIYEDLEGLTVTFTSNSEAIVIEGDKGLVTRDLSDSNVLINVHIDYLGTVRTYSFDFIVKGTEINQDVGFNIDVKDFNYIIGTEVLNYKENFTATFNNLDVTSEVTVDDSNVNLEEVGTYEIIYNYLLEDKTYSKTIYINVLEDADIIAPSIIGNKDFVHVIGNKAPNFLDGVTATDNIDLEVKVLVDISNIDLDTPGVYTIIFVATDSSGNESRVENTLTVKSSPNGSVDQIIETFENVTNSSSSYASGTFIGVNGLEWTYTGTRTDQSIGTGTALTFGNKGDGLLQVELEHGISSFSIDAETVFSGSATREIALYINKVEVAVFGVTNSVQTFTVDDLNYMEPVTLELRNKGNERVTFDNIVLGMDTKTDEEKHLDFVLQDLSIPLIFMDSTTITFLNESNNVDIAWTFKDLTNEYNSLVDLSTGLIEVPSDDLKVEVSLIATLTYEGYTLNKEFTLVIGEGEPITIQAVTFSENNSLVKTKGYVTSSVLNGNIYYAFIQDNNHGIYVESLEELTVGTEIIFKATKETISNVTTLVNLYDIKVIGEYNVNATSVNFNQLNNYLGMKVNLEGYLRANTDATQIVYELVSKEGIIKVELPPFINRTTLQNLLFGAKAGTKVNLEAYVYAKNIIYLINDNNLVIDETISELEVLEIILANIELPISEQEIYGDITLPITDPIFGSEITWLSSNDSVLTDDGIVIKPEQNEKVILTYQIRLNDIVIKEHPILVNVIPHEPLMPYYSRLEGLSGTSFNNELINMIKTIGRQTGTTSQVREIDRWNGSYYLIYDGMGSYGNREHTVPASYMRAVGRPEDDLHNLRAAKVSTNSTRSNYGFTDSTGGWQLINRRFWPGDEHKGDVARIVFYIATRNGIPFESTVGNVGPIGDLSMFLRWHEEDPVNEFEIERNNRIYGIQSNRNPFIDYPEFANRLWGDAEASNINMIDFDYTEEIILRNDLYYEEPRLYA